MLSNDNNGSAINVCIDDKQVTQLGNISYLQPIKITLTMENKKLLHINLNFDGTAAQGRGGEETNQESPNPTVTTQSYNSHSQTVTPVTATSESIPRKECAIQPNVGTNIIEYSLDLNNYYKLTNSNNNNSASSMSSISNIGRYRNGNRSMRSNKSNKSNNYDQSVSVQLYSPMNPNNMPKFEPTSKLIAALPDITNKFDALFPFYRLKDKDCKLLSQFVFDHIDSICKIFCDANGRWLNTKIYFMDSIDIKNNNNNNSKHKSIKYKRMSFYNDVATETEIKEWRNIEMNDQYCYIEAKNAKLKHLSNLKNNKSNNNNNNVNSNNNINNSNNKKRNSLLGIQKL